LPVVVGENPQEIVKGGRKMPRGSEKRTTVGGGQQSKESIRLGQNCARGVKVDDSTRGGNDEKQGEKLVPKKKMWGESQGGDFRIFSSRGREKSVSQRILPNLSLQTGENITRKRCRKPTGRNPHCQMRLRAGGHTRKRQRGADVA